MLREILALDSEACGNAHYDVAVEVYRGMQWASRTQLEDQNSEEYKVVSKLLFVSDRVLASDPNTSEEVCMYEAGRVRGVFGLSAIEASDRSTKIAADFYMRALDGAVHELDEVDAEMLQATRLRLGLSKDFIDAEHQKCYSSSVATVLGDLNDSSRLRDNMQFLQKMGSLLSFDTDRVNAIIMNRTLPAFQQHVRAAVASALQHRQVSSEAEQLVSQQHALHIAPVIAMKELQAALESNLALRHRDLLDCMRHHGDEAVIRFRELLETSRTSQSLWESVVQFQTEEMDHAWVADNYIHKISVVPDMELYHRLYESVLLALSRDGGLSVDGQSELATLQSLLRMPDSDVSRVVKSTMGPLLKHEISRVANSSELSTQLQDWVDARKIPRELYQQCALEYYEDCRKAMANDFAIIPKEKKEELDTLRELLNLSAQDTQPILEKFAGPVFIKSVEEAMSTSGGGVIINEYQDGLEKLRLRLGMTRETAREACCHAAKRFLRPTINKILSAFEAADVDGSSRTRINDAYGDGGAQTGMLGIASSEQDALLSEVDNLVAFLLGNKLICSSSTAPTWTYRINFTDVLPDSKLRHGLFRAAVVAQMRSIRPNDRAKNSHCNVTTYHFARLLGLPDSHIGAIRSEIGTRVIRNFCMKTFASRAVPDHRDLTFIESVAEQAGLDAPNSLFAAKKAFITSKVRGTPRVEWDASSVAEIRATAAAMGVDFPGELVLSIDERLHLFKCEASAVILADGDADIDSNLAELAEFYGVQEAFEGELSILCTRLARECLDSARVNYRNGDSLRVGAALDKVLAISTISHVPGLSEAVPAVEMEHFAQMYAKYCLTKYGVQGTDERMVGLRGLLQ
mmetsp:Transcript_14584/g.58247  ORF Transcript_14584/g.58247 Transcript_14584/m.58247 type:complete len:859 (+) Transcript_14584:836-3412(+)